MYQVLTECRCSGAGMGDMSSESASMTAPAFLSEGVDILGAAYERLRIDLAPDDEGPVVATLVRRRADNSARSILMIHGLADYFFKTHVADFLVANGWNVYGIDLRKYGRSLLSHQTPNLCARVEDYYPELDAALDLIVGDGAREVVVWGHSTGGLIALLWAQQQISGRISGVALNSPFLDFALPWVLRRPLMDALVPLGRWFPRFVVPQPTSTAYVDSTHRSRSGEWDYDLALKPAAGYPIRLGWLAAVRSAQRRLHRGLDLQLPVLVGCSSRSSPARSGSPESACTDIILDVQQIARWAPSIGPRVTLLRYPGALHDLTLSRPRVRQRVLEDLIQWADASVRPHST
jgi:alpha-beta hydrolase superfamily lysophospholipase